MPATGPVHSARELILELVELQDRIDEVRATDLGAEGAGTGVPAASVARAELPELPELVELVEREEQVIAELRDYRETLLTFPEPPPA